MFLRDIRHTVWVYVIYYRQSDQWLSLYFCKTLITGTLKAFGCIGKPLSMMLLFWFGHVSAPFFFSLSLSDFSGRIFACLFSSLFFPLWDASCYILLLRCGASSLKGLRCFPPNCCQAGLSIHLVT